MNFEKILKYIRYTPQNTNENILTQIIIETFEENCEDVYEGEYEIIPSTDEQVLLTANKFMTENIRIGPIPYTETENAAGGTTVTIG